MIRLLPIISPLIAIIFALIIGAILILIAGANPIIAYTSLFQESFSTYFGFGNTLTKMTPLLFTSLGVLFALNAGQFNIDGEGQIYLGALGSIVQSTSHWLYISFLVIWGNRSITIKNTGFQCEYSLSILIN